MNKLKINRYRRVAAKKWVADKKILDLLKDSGFELLHEVDFEYRTSLQLLDALISAYDVDDDCFYIGTRKIVPTLGDVALILGLPIDGKPVTGKDFNKVETREMCIDYLGSADFVHEKHDCCISLSKLRELMTVPDEANGHHLDKYVRAHVLYYLGTVLCPSILPDDVVPSMFLHVLKDTSSIKDFAWGAALFAHCMSRIRWLKKEINEGKKPTSVNCCALFLSVFILSHVPALTQAFYEGNAMPGLNTFPAMVQWTKFFSKPSNNSKRLVQDCVIATIFEEQSTEIDWRPFRKVRLPVHLLRQWHITYSYTMTVCFENVMMHNPHLCPDKLGIQHDELKDMKSLRLSKLKILSKSYKRSNPEKENWESKYAEQLSIWTKRTQRYVVTHTRDYEAEVDDEDESAEFDAGGPEELVPSPTVTPLANLEQPSKKKKSKVQKQVVSDDCNSSSITRKNRSLSFL